MKWEKVAFSIVAVLAGIVGGGLIGGMLGRPAAEGQMLASGAIVFFYLLIGALTGGVLAGVLSYRWAEKKVGWLALGMITIAVVAWLMVSAQAKERRRIKAEGEQPAPTSMLKLQEETNLLAHQDTLLAPAAAPELV